MNKITRNYESLYIVDSTLTDDQVEAISAKYANVVTEQGGEVQGSGRWDKRRLAFDVAGRREGIYMLMYFTGEPAVMNELDRLFKIADDVFRHIIVRVEPEHMDLARLEQQRPQAAEAEEAAVEEPAEAKAEEPSAEVEADQEVPAEPEAQAEAVAETAPEPSPEPEPEPVEEVTEPAQEQEAEPKPEESPTEQVTQDAEEIAPEESNDQPKQEDK